MQGDWRDEALCLKWGVTEDDDPWYADQSDLVSLAISIKKLYRVLGFVPELRGITRGVDVLSQEVARAVCDNCPVRVACLEEALRLEKSASIRYGIRGGMTGSERALIYRRGKRRAARPTQGPAAPPGERKEEPMNGSENIVVEVGT